MFDSEESAAPSLAPHSDDSGMVSTRDVVMSALQKGMSHLADNEEVCDVCKDLAPELNRVEEICTPPWRLCLSSKRGACIPK